MRDIELQHRIMQTLEFESSIDAAHIGVAAADGVVTLTGHVESYAEKLAVEQAARTVRGVKAIAQEIQVRLAAMEKHADDEIAQRALNILNWIVGVPADRIKVKVERGAITLTGEVNWQFQKIRAASAVRSLGGVTDVRNLIVVNPAVSHREVRTKIATALERTADVEAEFIRIDVKGSEVTLSGKVHSWAERSAATRAAWSAPGVAQVVDRLSIQA